jgi:hypothetical protein
LVLLRCISLQGESGGREDAGNQKRDYADYFTEPEARESLVEHCKRNKPYENEH